MECKDTTVLNELTVYGCTDTKKSIALKQQRFKKKKKPTVFLRKSGMFLEKSLPGGIQNRGSNMCKVVEGCQLKVGWK